MRPEASETWQTPRLSCDRACRKAGPLRTGVSSSDLEKGHQSRSGHLPRAHLARQVPSTLGVGAHPPHPQRPGSRQSRGVLNPVVSCPEDDPRGRRG